MNFDIDPLKKACLFCVIVFFTNFTPKIYVALNYNNEINFNTIVYLKCQNVKIYPRFIVINKKLLVLNA